MADRDRNLNSLARALRSLDGLSVGDAFGEACLVDTRPLLAHLAHRWLPDPPWAFADDTVIGISVVETLEEQPLTAFTRLAEPPAAR